MFAIDNIYNGALKASNILVVGDIIYDNYLFGNASRLSPEAPVPIFKPCNEEFRLGGAANVFSNIISLGASAQLCGLIGNDEEGANIRTRLLSLNNSPDLIIVSSDRPTTKKTRVLVGNHYLLRIDEETTSEIDEGTENKVFNTINDKIDSYDLLVVSDYNKGFLKRSFIRKVVDLFIDKKKKIIVDPKSDFYKYSGAFLIKPNLKELSKLVGEENIYNNYSSLIHHCNTVLTKGNFDYIYVTMGEKGGVLIGRDGSAQIIPAFGGKAVDITGAGDTTLAAIAVATATNVDIIKAVHFASCVAGISVSKAGTATVTKSEVASFIYDKKI
jgi:bifunctional protein hldE